jgi:membrane protein DedA with SNARE-associated domain
VIPETVLAAADATSIGYPLIFGGILLGSIVPVLPTGAVVGAAAAFAMTSDSLGLPLVLLVSTAAALLGDLVTFTVCRFGGPAAVRWVARGQHAERLEQVRGQFHRHGGLLIVAGRLLPAGRIPVLVAAGALAYPWRRLLPAAVVAAFLWAVAYALLGVVSGGVFDSPVAATLIATVLVLLVGAALNVVGSRRKRSRMPAATMAASEPDPSACGPA